MEKEDSKGNGGKQLFTSLCIPPWQTRVAPSATHFGVVDEGRTHDKTWVGGMTDQRERKAVGRRREASREKEKNEEKKGKHRRGPNGKELTCWVLARNARR